MAGDNFPQGNAQMASVAWLLLFWAMQSVAMLLFKWGSDTPGRFWAGFLGGNAFGASSISILMILYKTMNPNVAMGLALGGGFLAGNIAVAIVYKSVLSPIQYAGFLAIAVGMAMVSFGMKEVG